ncbi:MULTISPECIES: protein-disulfide reductase DsbD [unclassified Polaromonas]|uniref:protein-disulfide reductase DsbD family protein n=1 Tax=unclassified Polaromonas TaxID=2638319 RepID=UPI000F074AFD|nr:MULTISPECIES: thioredoxin family protein [unclassified Polaromonas]AYQ28110.1 protein-disulfide reductase [Polaromonas sp. SP1]QGJ17025.1 protein-disulfide reductase [Polaromonas sp. Pch-P]
MHFKRLLFTAAAATFLIAAGALSTWANAQNNALNFSLKSGSTGGAHAAVVTTEQVRAELLAWAPQGVEPGQPVWVGLQLTHQPEWHTYWKNSGDSGLPTELIWQLPAGITAGEIAWPTPKKIPIGTLANYGYEKTVLLPVPLTVAPGFAGTQLQVKLKAAWLVCRKECIPQEGDFSLSIPVKSSTAASGELFEQTFKATPKTLAAGASQVGVADKAIQVSLAGLPAALQGKTLEFYPETGSVIEPAAAWQQAWQGAVWTASVPLSGQRTESPASMPLVVALGDTAYRIDAPVKGAWPAVAAAVAMPPALEAALKANAATGASTGATSLPAGAPLGLFAALLGALLGGLILNLMPCVFPVLAIKVVGFVHVKDPATRVTTGLAYTLGVVLSFLALGALLLGLRVAGQQLGWGFHLQSPAVVAVLAALFTLLGLNLAGLFEFGNFLPGRMAGWQAKNPTVNAFLSGVLATAIASPCTAPFMGASLGYAIGLPALEALAIFAAIGIGMALPYLAASAIPAVARALPRPGAWMVTFKQLMAFPMFATVAWLVWVLGQQSGIDGAGALLALLVLMALAIWALTLRGTARTLIATFSIALCAIGIWAIGPNVIKPAESAPTAAADAAPGGWQAWAPGRVDQLAGQGQSVFVDFTAAWCVTCQYNKKTTLANADVLADMKAKNVAMLRADWTRRDPAVTAALARLGRSGVPVYVIYKPGRAPVVLSEILSVDDVRAELAKL